MNDKANLANHASPKELKKPPVVLIGELLIGLTTVLSLVMIGLNYSETEELSDLIRPSSIMYFAPFIVFIALAMGLFIWINKQRKIARRGLITFYIILLALVIIITLSLSVIFHADGRLLAIEGIACLLGGVIFAVLLYKLIRKAIISEEVMAYFSKD